MGRRHQCCKLLKRFNRKVNWKFRIFRKSVKYLTANFNYFSRFSVKSNQKSQFLLFHLKVSGTGYVREVLEPNRIRIRNSANPDIGIFFPEMSAMVEFNGLLSASNRVIHSARNRSNKKTYHNSFIFLDSIMKTKMRNIFCLEAYFV